MEIDEIENIYSEDISKSNEYFINALKNKNSKTNIKSIENKFKEKLSYAKQRYEKNMISFLKVQKNKKKPKKKIKKEKIEHFEEKGLNYKRSFYKSMKIKTKIFLFRSKITLGNLEEKYLPYSVSYHYKKYKVVLHSKYIAVKNRTNYYIHTINKISSRKYEEIENRFKKLLDKIKLKLKNALSKIKEYFTKIKTLVRKIKFKREKKVEPQNAPSPTAVPKTENNEEIKSPKKEETV